MSDHEDDIPNIVGQWKVIDCCHKSTDFEEDLLNWIVTLEQSGGLTWQPPSPPQQNPFVAYTSYEVDNSDNMEHFDDWYTLRLLDEKEGVVMPLPMQLLKNRQSSICGMRWTFTLGPIDAMEISLERVDTSENIFYDLDFSLLDALTEGYFTDMIIKDDIGGEHAAHSVVLGMTLSTAEATWLQRQPATVIRTILHYCYAECFPLDLTLDGGNLCLDKLPSNGSTHARLFEIKMKLQGLLNKMKTKERAFVLLDDVERALSRCADSLSDTNILSTPSKLVVVIKTIVRELAVTACRILLLCDLLERGRLHKKEKKNLLRKAHSRAPVLIQLLERIVETLNSLLSASGKFDKTEIVVVLVPEVEVAITTFDTLSGQLVRWSDGVVQKMSSQKKGVKALKNMKEVMHRSDYNKAKKLYTHLLGELQTWRQHRDNFMQKNAEERQQQLISFLDFISQEVSFNHERVMGARKRGYFDRITGADSWPTFKTVVRKKTAKISWYLSQLRRLSGSDELQDLLGKLCTIVHRPELESALLELGLRPASVKKGSPSKGDEAGAGASSSKKATSPSKGGDSGLNTGLFSLGIGPVNTQSPHTRESQLAVSTAALLQNSGGSDLVISCSGVDLPAHRVLVAARCPWLKRLLKSGMKEAVEGRIRLPEASMECVQRFLQFLYSGKLVCDDAVSTVHLMELLELADAYEVDGLKIATQRALSLRLDRESAVPLLSLAERLGDSAKLLRDNAITFVKQNKYELPAEDEALLSEGVKNLLKADVAPDQEQQPDDPRMAVCLSQLREITGTSPSNQELKQIIQKADYDLNRAVNFYLS